MNMYYILLIIFIGSTVKSETDSEEAKHIDSLPEKEKGEFLEKISRRIFNDVQTKDARLRSSGEMSDDQLDEHDDFVHKILNEESANMRKNSAKKLKEEDRKSQENTEKALERDEITNEDVRHIDLTMRERKEITGKYHSGDMVTIKEHEEDMGSNTESENIVNVVNEDYTTKSINKDFVRSDIDDIQVIHFRRYSSEDEPNKRNSIKIKTTTDSDTQGKTVMLNFETEILKSNLDEVITTPEIEAEENITDIELKKNTTDFIEITTTPNESSKEVRSKEETSSSTTDTDKKSDVNHKVTDNSEDATIKNFSDSDVSEITTIDVESDTTSSTHVTNIEIEPNDYKTYRYLRSIKQDTDTYEKNNLTDTSTVAINYLTQDKHSTIIDISYTTIPSVVPVTSSPIHDKNLTNSEIVLDVDLKKTSVVKEASIHNKSYVGNNTGDNMILMKYNTTLGIENNNVSYPDNYTIENKLTKKDESDIGHIANTLIQMLRQGLSLDNNDKYLSGSNLSDLKTFYRKDKAKGHVVFEIPLNEASFIRKKESKTKEPPYYVPVYNYSPNNAYYRAHNRLGPNADDPSSERIVIKSHDPMSDDEKDFMSVDNMLSERRFRFRNKDSKHSKLSRNIPYRLNMPVVIRNPTLKFYNPDDYIDMDIYYDRTNFGHPVERTKCKSDSEVEEYHKVIEDKKSMIPDSYEENHPSIPRNNLQGHMRAIRKILYQNKHFGYSPPPSYATDYEYIRTGKSSYLRSKLDDTVIKTKLKTAKDQNIASDYYSRTSIKFPKDTQKENYNKYSNSLKDLNFEDIPEDIIRYADILRYKNNFKVDEPSTRFVSHFDENKREYSKAVKHARPDYFRSNSEEDVNYINKIMKTLLSKEGATQPKKETPKHIDLTRTVKSASNGKDLIINLNNLLAMSSTIRKNSWLTDFDVYVIVLKNMIKMDSVALKQYDWLGTAVNIQAALAKLLALTESLLNEENLHPLDLELLKYIILLHKSSKNIIETNETGNLEEYKLRSNKKELLPRNKRKKKKKYLKEKGLLNRVWLYREGYEKDRPNKNTAENDIVNFYDFLNDLQYQLYDLHIAIKSIAVVTKYNRQKWFDDLKRIYFISNKRELLKIILHLTTTRLLGLIEDSAKNGAEESYYTYIKENRKSVLETREEFVFVLSLLNQLKKIDDT